jgi:hypothetical protein
LVVISQIIEGELRDRWIAHKSDRLDLRFIQPGEALRVFRLPSAGTALQGAG